MKINLSSADPSASQRLSKITPVPHLSFLSTAIVPPLLLPVVPALLSRRSLVICTQCHICLSIVLYLLSSLRRCATTGSYVTSPLPQNVQGEPYLRNTGGLSNRRLVSVPRHSPFEKCARVPSHNMLNHLKLTYRSTICR